MNYRNVFEEFGHSKEEIDARLEEIFQTIFYGPEGVRFYYPVGDDMGYMTDTGNNDARSEGMSYGMMMCVQLDKKEEFDRIWKWVKTYMYLDHGFNKGYYCWSNALDGTKNADGPAPDGEEFFSMALIMASHRWGDGEGVFNYSKEAKDILMAMIHNKATMFTLDTHMIRFVAGCGFSDPSYHLPHFYEEYAKFLRDEAAKLECVADACEEREMLLDGADFYDECVKASREYFKKACDPNTGMNAEYANFDGTPTIGFGTEWGRHDYFFSDAYRTAANMGLDYAWSIAKGQDPDEFEAISTAKLRAFYEDKNMPDENGEPHYYVYEINGKQVPSTENSDFASSGKVLHPYGLIATNAQSYLATDPSLKDKGPGAYAVEQFWNLPLRTGVRRYYDNCLYLFAFMALSGNYRIW